MLVLVVAVAEVVVLVVVGVVVAVGVGGHTWVVAGDTCGAAKSLPEKRWIFPAVLHEHLLQCLGPV